MDSSKLLGRGLIKGLIFLARLESRVVKGGVCTRYLHRVLSARLSSITRQKSAIFRWEVAEEEIIRKAAAIRRQRLEQEYNHYRNALFDIGDMMR